MKILKYGPLVRQPEWPKIRTCQNCGSTIELERKDTKTSYINRKPEECYRCPACYKYNLLDRTIPDREEYQKFDEILAEQAAKQLQVTLDFWRNLSAESYVKLEKAEAILKGNLK